MAVTDLQRFQAALSRGKIRCLRIYPHSESMLVDGRGRDTLLACTTFAELLADVERRYPPGPTPEEAIAQLRWRISGSIEVQHLIDIIEKSLKKKEQPHE